MRNHQMIWTIKINVAGVGAGSAFF